ncbi:hypothetical protein ACFS7Z_06440 [Pontibacter toksunensis]|uniref:Nuclear transport factor 2 family protein n=1 Tax=Pontibacter toksunensis TaxID=1332631 RepID=A0ABW6BSA2_9BACT
MQELDELTQALYQSISFEKGEQPDLPGLGSLFYEGGRLINNNKDQPQEYTVQQFIQVVEEQIESGSLVAFREQEISSRTEVFGKIAHRFSTYEAYLNDLGAAPFSVGINSIQFMKVKDKWYVCSMVWNDQQQDRLIPAKYFEY